MNAKIASDITASAPALSPYTEVDCFNCEFAWGIQCAANSGETSWEYEDRGWKIGKRNLPGIFRYIFGMNQKAEVTEYGRRVLDHLLSLGFTVGIRAEIITWGSPLLLVVKVQWRNLNP